jgi:hypothetical protein
VKNLRSTPVSLCKAVQNDDRNSLSLSETISRGRPFLQYHSLKKGQLGREPLMSRWWARFVCLSLGGQ